MQCGYDANDDENRERFDQWFATRAFTSAIERAVRLECAVEDAESQRDALAERVAHLESGIREVIGLFSEQRSGAAFLRLITLAAPTAPKEAT